MALLAGFDAVRPLGPEKGWVMDRESASGSGPIGRRQFITWLGRRGTGLYVAGASAPALLAACASQQPVAGTAGATPAATAAPVTPAGTVPATEVTGAAIVGDVVDFALTSTEWEGPFGWVRLRLHRGFVDGNDVYYIRTDASDEAFARDAGLVYVPKLQVLAGSELAGVLYLFDDRPSVLSSEPGRGDYTPAWQVRRVTLTGKPGELRSVEAVEAAAEAGDARVTDSGIVVNAPLMKWSGGELPVDDERTEYLGPGQLLEPPDTDAMEVRFKLHECYPDVRYIVTDVELAPMAEGMAVGHSPRLQGTSQAGATGRTNVFMNGLEGPGPMGFQPSVFDTPAGSEEWSPYWDHFTYAWKEGVTPRVLSTEEAVHQARDDQDLDEFPGTPDTNGATFVVNCPVPVLAPNTFQA